MDFPKEVVEAPTFALPDLSGRSIRLEDFRGKVVFLNFFATWCAPCREEMPTMERLYRTYKDKGLVVVAVNVREDSPTVQAFARELTLSFPILRDHDASVARSYAVRPLPVTYLIGRDGRVLWRAFGSREWDRPPARQVFSSLMEK